MAQNYIESGERLDLVAGATITSGDIVAVGDMVGVALGDAASGDTVVIAMEGVFECTKVTLDEVAQGDTLYVDGDGLLTTAADDGEVAPTAFVKAGYAWKAAAATTATTVQVKLG